MANLAHLQQMTYTLRGDIDRLRKDISQVEYEGGYQYELRQSLERFSQEMEQTLSLMEDKSRRESVALANGPNSSKLKVTVR